VPEVNEHDYQSRIIWLGRLDGGVSDKNIWLGNISAEQPDLRKKSKDEYRESLDKYFVEVSPNSPVRCIDGRPKKGNLFRRAVDIIHAKLGPQTPGGTPAVALAIRIAEFDRLPKDKTIVDDLNMAKERYDALGLAFPPGNHEDDHPNPHKTGCGAIDKMPEILAHMTNAEALPIIANYAKSIIGEDFTDEAFRNVIERLHIINGKEFKRSYLIQDKDGSYRYKSLIPEQVRKLSGHDAIEQVEGEHKELFLVINKVEGTTFNRDHFCLDSENEAQAFNYDYWFVKYRADRLYANDPATRAEFLIAKTMYAVSTAMVLTDGSLEVGIRQ